MARDHHRGLMARDPLHEIDIAEIPLAAPAGWRVRRRRVIHPDPVRQPLHRGLPQLRFEALLDQGTVPPRAYREERVADGQAVAVAGDAEFADLADPARDFFALGAMVVEVMIARAKDHAGD